VEYETVRVIFHILKTGQKDTSFFVDDNPELATGCVIPLIQMMNPSNKGRI
jgi:hypothetical protein